MFATNCGYEWNLAIFFPNMNTPVDSSCIERETIKDLSHTEPDGSLHWVEALHFEDKIMYFALVVSGYYFVYIVCVLSNKQIDLQ